MSRNPFPVILERTPYGKGKHSRSEIDVDRATTMSPLELASYFVSSGYVVVFQDCRGRHGSEGTFEKYTAEAEDGFDTCAWIHAQTFCNGRIGTMGLSYAAHTQAALAALNPPGLSAMILDFGGFSNAFQGGIRQGGAFELKQATWALRQAIESPEAQADPKIRRALQAEDIRDWFKRMPWRPGRSPLRWLPEYERYLLEQWSRGNFDESWQRPGLCASAHWDNFPDCPVAIMSSWYDAYVATATENYVGLKARKNGPFHLIMGPWRHGDRTMTYAGDISFGPEAPIDGHIAENWRAYRLAWFDRWLKDTPNEVDATAAVRLFVMGGGSGGRTPEGRLDHGGRWIDAADWPLRARASIVLRPCGRHLSPEPPGRRPESRAFVFDPANPVPTIGGSLHIGRAGVHRRRLRPARGPAGFSGARPPGLPLNARPDVLSFETPPLERDLILAGPIEVVVYLSSDCPDTDVTAKLVDVYPPSEDDPRGFALNITDGIMRCRYRDFWESACPMDPGSVYRIVIRPFATANLFKAGHRIRLDVSSSNFPKLRRQSEQLRAGRPGGNSPQGRKSRVARPLMAEPHRTADRRPSVGRAAARQVEHRAGGEGVLLPTSQAIIAAASSTLRKRPRGISTACSRCAAG